MKKVLVIVGPTGSGKSQLGITLAQQFQGEIISGDSIQIYQGMNIGSAKITQQQMQGIPHHLIDCYPADYQYSVMQFQQQGRQLIDEIIARNHLPIIVGGTGLYIKALLYDYQFNQEPLDQHLLDALNNFSDQQLYEELLAKDPTTAQQVHPNNRQRLIRAVYFNRVNQQVKSEHIAAQQHQLLYDARIISLTMPRDQLHKVINQRVDIMMEQGLLAEVTQLVNQYPNAFQLQSMKAIGYKEWEPYFNQQATKESVVAKIKTNTRRLAKKQYTWFHHQMQVQWVDVTTNYQSQLREDVKQWLQTAMKR